MKPIQWLLLVATIGAASARAGTSVETNRVTLADETELVTVTESRRDVNGVAVPRRIVTEQVQALGDGETRTERLIQAYDHTNARFGPAGRELSTARTVDRTTFIETVVQKPAATGWRDEERIVIVENRAEPGVVDREIIEERRPLFDRQTAAAGVGDSLEPRVKTVERETIGPDGEVVIERQTFRRDVNGEWRAPSFSTDTRRPIQ
jgi:hypothetical protein